MKHLKNIFRDILRFFLGKKIYTYIRFILVHKYIPNFKQPSSFSEKIIFRKLYDNPKKYSSFVDKYTVRKYIESKIGSDYLIPLLKAKKFITPSDFDSLPNEFVIKTSNGGGGENVLIVNNKNSLNLDEICDRFNNYLKVKIGNKIDEYFYDIEQPMILFEKLLRDDFYGYPPDFKIHIFNGIKNKKIIQIDEGRFNHHKRSLYNEKKEKLPFNIQPKYESVSDNFPWPKNWNEMLDISMKLADDFKYVRVDLYNVNGKIFFGELTFCHGSGWEPIYPKKYDFLLGKYWHEYE
ncbi:ATP-grasp fold amidoligase family protein [Proteus mirabilis]|uniref:ATP-grasp fold amidoligase family protein n=2 Tax=Proteus mirabilis TaxID=584 RepID=UPI0007DC253C|nr:ATP-grasp fold amidoligase family protein [Proteus mirabilis]SSL79459.1 glycosyltransferase [Klebsiella pneumoniae]MCL8612165.1 hypothetical protein [Proteus mirabilis]MDC5886046.1 ATP-grasp fold amidoligase family protein [Proteus mirabilis]MDC5903643.1 ATP-grasp fold amidoligase family protein [Proteus mirabilis]MDC5907192.1 ATP-grasp fold amidoligase family protein [Proteus mirabilis]